MQPGNNMVGLARRLQELIGEVFPDPTGKSFHGLTQQQWEDVCVGRDWEDLDDLLRLELLEVMEELGLVDNWEE